MQPDQAHETVEDQDTKPLISTIESDDDSGSKDKLDKEDTVNVEVHETIEDQDTKPVESEHDSAGSKDKPDKEDSLNVEVHYPDDVDHVGDKQSAPKENGEAAVDEHEDNRPAVTVDPTQLEGEEHDNQITGVDEVNRQPDVDADPETVPAEEKPSEEVPSQKKIDDQDVNLPSEDHQKPEPAVALSKAKLHKYLESKGLQYQMLPPESEEEKKDPQTLEAILNEYTALDVLDEENKFICQTCTDNRESC